MDRTKLIAYAHSFLSFLFARVDAKDVQKVILFGSVARGDFTDESDVDIFIESTKSEIIKEDSARALSDFISSRTYKEWTLRGVKNSIQLHVGKLDKLTDLKRSLISDGIILYGKFSSEEKGDHFLLIAFKPIKNKAKRYRVERYLFGRKERRRKVSGVVDEYNGRKLTSRSFIIPSLQASQIVENLKQEKVDFIMFDVWSDSI